MRKEIIMKSVLITVVSLVFVLLLFTAVNLRAEQKLDLTITWIAARDIPPRTKITEEDLLETEVPGVYLMSGTVQDKEQIIGKYTDIQGMIPAGSPFFEEMLCAETELPDNPTAQLRDGQSAYTLETDLAKLGGTILPGQKVDIYAALQDRDGSPVSGCLIENVRVIAVKDHKGLDMDDPESSGTPYLTILAVCKSDLPYLSAAETAGSVRLIASVRTYDNDVKEAELQKGTPLLNYLDALMLHAEPDGTAELTDTEASETGMMES